jgi:signal transduction histidine kinase
MKNQPALQIETNGANQTLELIAFLTYEFKTQLNSITNSASLLGEELALFHNDTKTKLIGNILTSSHYLDARAAEILDLAKLHVEGFNLELEKTDVDTIIYRAVDRLLPKTRNRKQSLHMNLVPHPPKVIADPLRIEQVLHNLLSNASKFTPAGGNLFVSTDKQAGYIVIKIQDSSPCIPREEQRELFQPYYRLIGERDTQVTRTGLGLALCKRLIELHGGRIWLESKENHGNNFAFTLPLNNR